MKKNVAIALLLLSTSHAPAANIEVTPTSTDSGVPLSNTTVVNPSGYGGPSATGPGFSNGSCDPTLTNKVGKLNENWCSSANIWVLNSSDPSSGLNLPFTGTPFSGDQYTLNFHYNATTVSVMYTAGSNGDPVTYPVIIARLASAIESNATLFGQGFAGGKLVAYAVYLPGDRLGIDVNSTIPLKMSYTVSGGHSEVITFPPGHNASGTFAGGSTQGVQYDVGTELDNNPALIMIRTPGVAPVPGSQLAAIVAVGVNSGCSSSTVGCSNYGAISNWVYDSDVSTYTGKWLVQGFTSGAGVGGVWVGSGVFSNYGGSVATSAALADPLEGSFNAGRAYRIGQYNSAPTVFDTIDTVTSGKFRMATVGTGNAIQITSPNGITLEGSAVSIISPVQFQTLFIKSTSNNGAAGFVVESDDGARDVFAYAFNSSHGGEAGIGTSKSGRPFLLFAGNTAYLHINAGASPSVEATNGAVFKAAGVAGIATCSGTPTSGFTVKGGIVTAC